MSSKPLAWVAGAVVIGAGVFLIARSGGYGPPSGAQSVAPVAALEQAKAAYPEPFSVVSTVREMPDGRVLVADPLGQVLVRVDLGSGTADTLGSVGEGPAEYRQPDAVWPLPEGRTLLVDLGNGRLTELDPDLVFGETRPYTVGAVAPGRDLVIAIPQAVDGQGRLYFRGLGQLGAGTIARDSADILRLDLETEVVDTVARFGQAATTQRTSGGPNNQNTSISPIPLSPADAWGVAHDGRVVVARAADYRVEWIAPGGAVTSGPPVPYDRVAIGRAEKEEWQHARSETGGGLGLSLSISNGSTVMSASRGGASGDDEDLDQYDWPDVKPAFWDGAIPVDPAGRAWVRLHRAAGDAPAYDVFGPDGGRVMTVELPQARRVVSFGDGTLYAVRMDEVGLQFLERYALP